MNRKQNSLSTSVFSSRLVVLFGGASNSGQVFRATNDVELLQITDEKGVRALVHAAEGQPPPAVLPVENGVGQNHLRRLARHLERLAGHLGCLLLLFRLRALCWIRRTRFPPTA